MYYVSAGGYFGTGGSGGTQNAGNGGYNSSGGDAAAYHGAGGGGGSRTEGATSFRGGNGGSGFFSIGVPTAGYTVATTGSPSTTISGDYTYYRFESSGTITIS